MRKRDSGSGRVKKLTTIMKQPPPPPPPPPSAPPPSITIATCSLTHCVQVCSGKAYAWATSVRGGNRFGQLGRPKSTTASERTDEGSRREIILHPSDSSQISGVAAGGSKDSGHTLLLDVDGNVHAIGCDRWQQLGLGSTKAGAVGYTWKGRLWHYTPQRVHALPTGATVQVAAGDDHSVALLESGQVWTWGRGEHGQLGVQGAPFVMPPTRSLELSVSPFKGGDGSRGGGVQILAEGNCTGVIHTRGGIGGSGSGGSGYLKYVGKCKKDLLDKWKKIAETVLE